MRILVEILHPAHVHFFRHFILEMRSRGHEILVTARAKDVTTALLDAFEIPYRTLSVQRRGMLGLTAELLSRTRRLLPIIEEFRPDFLTGIMGPTIALAGSWKGVKSVVFYDTETATLTNPWVFRLADAVCTPASFPGRVPGRHLRYAGYHDLAYLHPGRFRPDPGKLRNFGLDPGRPFSFARFVSFEASHDVGHRGMSLEGQIELLQHLASLGDVVVSTEGPLPPGLPARPLRGPVHEVHHVLAGAEVVVGDSGTMSSEAAVLGTPAVFISTARLGVLLDLENRYGVMANVLPYRASAAIAAVTNLLGSEGSTRRQDGRRRLLAESVDVTAWMVDHFERMSWST